MNLILTLTSGEVLKKATIIVPNDVCICSGVNLILQCNKNYLRIPIKEVDIDPRANITVAHIDPKFPHIDQLLNAPEIEWFTAPT